MQKKRYNSDRCWCFVSFLNSKDIAPQSQGVISMNKKLKSATKNEIARAYQDNVPAMISNLRFRVYSKQDNIFNDMRTGEVISRNGFNMYVAEKFNKGFEYRIYRSNKDRKARLKERVSNMIIKGNAIFLTLTFNEDFLARETNENTRRRYISRFLKEQCKEYIANVDYGEREDCTHREHYHALVIPKATRIDFKPYCAFFDGSRIYSEKVHISKKSNDSISRYISKLTNHALKQSGQYKRLIYSRS